MSIEFEEIRFSDGTPPLKIVAGATKEYKQAMVDSWMAAHALNSLPCRPMNDYVLVDPIDPATEMATRSGLAVASMDKPRVSTGEILAMSPDIEGYPNAGIPEVGKTVYYPTGLGFDFLDATGKRYLLIRMVDCLAWR